EAFHGTGLEARSRRSHTVLADRQYGHDKVPNLVRFRVPGSGRIPVFDDDRRVGNYRAGRIENCADNAGCIQLSWTDDAYENASQSQFQHATWHLRPPTTGFSQTRAHKGNVAYAQAPAATALNTTPPEPESPNSG